MSRFRPVRAGIVNLWDYTEHRFAFHGGRLVLRGANGSGKTKALELLFPFLLDANTAPQRLDPFTGVGRTMRDNLLYRPERDTVTGYAWLEFVDAENGRVVVIGAGLRAQRSGTGVTSWFFVTQRAMDDGWSLLGPERQPLSLRELREVLGADDVFDRAGPYRERVDAELFGGVGRDRYAALVQLVLHLRKPQLAKDLDLRQLSDTLSAGLRPLDDELVAEGARSFDDLEAVQRELERLERACRAAERFARVYTPYVRVVARARVDRVRDAAARLAQAERSIAEAEVAHTEAETAAAEATAALDRARADMRRFTDERDTLHRSAAYQAVGQLDDLRRHVASASSELDRAADQRARAEALRQRAATAHDEARREHEIDVAATDRSFERLRASAVVVAPERVGEIDALASVGEPGPVSQAIARERRLDLHAVRNAAAALDRASAEAVRAEQDLAEATTALDAAAAALDAAVEEEASTRAALRRALVEFRGRWSWVTDEDLDALSHACETRLPELRSVLGERLAERRHDAAAALARLEEATASTARERATVDAERERVLAERDDAPAPPPVTRRERDGARGAPLWRLVDFAPQLADDERTGLEAALAAAGLLDAWIAPHGAPTDDELDVFLARSGPAAEGPSLAALLVPDVPDGAAVGRDDVAAVLAAVSLDAIGCRVATDGRFVLGPLHGRSAKTTAEFIGATARAARRARRAAELADALAALDGTLADLAARARAVTATIDAFDRGAADLPSVGDVHAAARRVDEATAARDVHQDEHTRRAERATAASAGRAAAFDALRAEAARRGLPTDAEGLDAFDTALQGFEAAAREHASAGERVRRSAERVAERAERHAEREAEHAEAARLVVDREATHLALRAQLATLEDTIGTAASDVLAALGRVEADLAAADTAQDEAQARHTSSRVAIERAESQRARAADDRAAADVDRRSALDGVRVVRRPELRAVLGLDDPDSLERFAELVDDATRGTAAGDDRRQATKTAVRNAFKELETHLGPRYHATLDDADDVDLAMITDDDGRTGVAGFAERVARRRDEQRLLLSAQERQVLEDTLVDTLCRQLHQRMGEADQQVARMNGALAGRHTTSGKGVQLTWSANDELSEDQRQIVKLLDRDPAYLGADRQRLREALAAEIRTARAHDPAATYQAVLARVLDYRAWRRFGVRVRERDGTERTLTRKLFNQHSGGERATILHLPLFAAAAAHFEAAQPGCPRLIALDEAFAGIDQTTTRQLLALTVEFDLDVFLTGHDFWGTVPEVPELAIVQLSHDRDSHTVSNLAMRWDGAVLHDEG